MAETTQPSFTGGVLGPALAARADIARYPVSLKSALNMFIHPHGGISNRAGTDVVGKIVDSAKVGRLIPFEFNTEQAYSLLFEDLLITIVKDGGFVIDIQKAITGVTQANPAVVTSASHTFNNGDQIVINDVVGMTELNGKRFEVANKTAGTYELLGVDSTSFTAYSSGGLADRIYSIASPYLEADLFNLKYTQSNDVMTIFHPSYKSRELTRTGHSAWTITTNTWGTLQAKPGALVIGAATAGTIVWDYAVVAVNETTFEKSLARTGSSGSTVSPITATDWVTIQWADTAGAGWYEVYRGQNGTYNYITTVDASYFKDEGQFIPNPFVTPPYDAGNFFDTADDRPACGAYYQQRLMMGGTNNFPQTVYGTQTGNYKNMNKHFPVQDSDSVNYALNASKGNIIRHIAPMDGLLILTSGSEWLLDGGSLQSAITPSNVNARIRGKRGASQVQPIIIGDSLLFIQARGSIVRDIKYSAEENGYIGDNLSIYAEHYFENYTITDWCYSQSPHSIIWAVRSDGKLLSLGYLKEHSVWGWTEHETDGTVESICSIPEGAEDVVYMIVRRLINGEYVRFVEKLHSRLFTDIRDAYFVDCGLTLDAPVVISGITQADPVVVTATGHNFLDGYTIDLSDIVGTTELNLKRYVIANKTANTFELTDVDTAANIDGTAFGAYISDGKVRRAVSTISGLHHLEGKSVTILADGSVHPNQTVTDGVITLTYKASRVHVGLGYVASMETLNVEFPQTGTAQGRKKNITKVNLKVKDSRGFHIGPSADKLTEAKWRDDELYSDPTELFTGDKKVIIVPEWKSSGSFMVQQPDPLPLTILAATPEVEVGG